MQNSTALSDYCYLLKNPDQTFLFKNGIHVQDFISNECFYAINNILFVYIQCQLRSTRLTILEFVVNI